MCTGFIKRGDDLLYGFNLDIDPEVWDFRLVKNKKIFTAAIKVGKTLYYTHGVNAEGCFSNLPYMNGPTDGARGGKNSVRVDLLTDRYLRNKLSFDELLSTAKMKTVLNVSGASMHSLVGSPDGRMLLLEPQNGFREITEDYAAIANFPVLCELSDYNNPFYGRDRYDTATKILSESKNDFSVRDGLELLRKVKTEGKWGTKISFVYSKNENAVYYCLNGDFEKTEKHCLG